MSIVQNVTLRVINWFLIFLMCCLLLGEARGSTGGSDTYETIEYKGEPIKLVLKTNEESILVFPWALQMGLNSDDVGKAKITIVGDHLYFTPLLQYENVRYYPTDTVTGAKMIIDITASSDATPIQRRVTDARNDFGGESEELPESQGNAVVKRPSSGRSRDLTYVDMVRAAFQAIYSPAEVRTLPDSMSLLGDEDGSGAPGFTKDLVPGKNISARLLKQWRVTGGRFVFALELSNQGSGAVELDIRNFRHSMDWLASSLMSERLSGVGDVLQSRTAMVVVSAKRFQDGFVMGVADNE